MVAEHHVDCSDNPDRASAAVSESVTTEEHQELGVGMSQGYPL
jgi:hypothetical protein